MNETNRSSIGLVVKIIIILLLPLFLFRYVDSQPTTVIKDEDDEGTRSVAIVNEDNGLEINDEEVILGQDIPLILEEQHDYSWKVVKRSAAERGFSNQEYDAIMYIPSNFSESIMTFKDPEPTKASINYVIQPNLEAKERQRVHREMANAKNGINQEMSMIYWSYISQEVDDVKEQFDHILGKEIDFQESMYSFYTPSSQSLAGEIENHTTSLEGILNQTGQIQEVSSDKASAAEGAEEQLSTFTEALETYKEAQGEQQSLLMRAQAESQAEIKAGIDTYNETIETDVQGVNEKLQDQSVAYADKSERMLDQLRGVRSNVQNAGTILDRWGAHDDKQEQTQVDEFAKISTKIVTLYNDELLDQVFESTLKDANKKVKTAIKEVTKAPIDQEIIEPTAPKETEELDFDTLAAQIDHVETEVNEVKERLTPEEPEPEPDPEPDPDPDEEAASRLYETDYEDNWTAVSEAFIQLNETFSQMQDEYGNNEEVESWKEYAAAWEVLTAELTEAREDAKEDITTEIRKKQKAIVKSDTYPDSDDFPKTDDLTDKTIESLVDYMTELTTYKAVHDQKAYVGSDMIDDIMDTKEIRTKMREMEEHFANDSTYANEMRTLLGIPVTYSNEGGKSFIDLANETELQLDDYKIQIEEGHATQQTILENMQASTDGIAAQLRDVNEDVFDWEESSSIDYLDGQMVFQIHKSTSADLKQLSELVVSLDENQHNITSSTDEMQTKVASVQEKSDELNDNWSENVASTELVRDDVYGVLGNTNVDGQTNPFVYNHLSNPVNVEGNVNGTVLSETEDRLPPVILFLIILISGLLIGFLSHYYSSSSYLVQAGLFIILNVAVGLIISIYGLSIYSLPNAQALQWSLFTITLLFASANIVRGALFIGPFVGWLASMGMIIFFVTPLINVVVPDFSFNNPITNAYMTLQFSSQSISIWMMVILILITVAVSAFIYGLQVTRNKAKVGQDEEVAA